MKSLSLAAALFAATGSAALGAQVPPPPGVAQGTERVAPMPAPSPMQMHMRMMADKPMTRDDVVRHVRTMFAKLDANRDGFVTRDELQSMHEHMMGAMHAGFDRGAAFDRLDTNHDGMVSRQEFMAAQPLMRERRMIAMRQGETGTHMGGMGMAGHLFEMADLNHDGRVSLAEAQQAALQHFDRMDLNHDGVLTPDERRQAHQMMRGQHHPA